MKTSANFIAIGLLALVFAILPFALLAKKAALVIGNSAYTSVSALPNPRNDANALAEALTAQGFEVIKGEDLDRNEMYDALRAFRDLADHSEIALVFYAGHGIEIAGQNYLIPVDAELADERDATLEMINVNVILRQISAATSMKMVVLDACRNNPFAKRMKREQKGRGVGRGLANIESTQADTLIAYAAAAGEITPDGEEGANSPFSTALLKALAGPPQDVRRLLGAVRDEMRLSVPGSAPFVYSSLGGKEYIINPNGEKPTPLQTAPSPLPETASTETTPDFGAITADFARADRQASLQGWENFLTTYRDQNYHLLYALGLEKREALRNQPARNTAAPTSADTTLDVPTISDTVETNDPESDLVVASLEEPMTLDEATRAFQTELKKHGCYPGRVDGVIGRGSLSGLSRFSDLIGSQISLGRKPDLYALEQATAILQNHPHVDCPRTASVSRSTPSKVARKPRASAPPAQPVAAPKKNKPEEKPSKGAVFKNTPNYCPQYGAAAGCD